MRVAINALFLEPGMGGIQTYVTELLPRLADQNPQTEFVVFANPSGASTLATSCAASNVRVVSCRHLGRRGFRAVSEAVVLDPLKVGRLDVVFNVASTGPVLGPTPSVVVVHDLIWLLHPDVGDGDSLTPFILRRVVPRAARHARRVIALTDSGAADLVRHLGVDRARTRVIGHGVRTVGAIPTADQSDIRRALGLEGRVVILNVAPKKAHKNLHTLIAAFALVHAAEPRAVLVLPGAPTAHESALREDAAQRGLAGAVRFPGYLSDREIDALYAVADCFVFPSVIEGFGMPILEAMAHGTPVICANDGVPAEVAGDAALQVDVRSPQAIAAAVHAVLEDDSTRATLKERGLQRAAAASWDETARATMRVIREAVAT